MTVLIYEPENDDALNFQSLIDEKITLGNNMLSILCCILRSLISFIDGGCDSWYELVRAKVNAEHDLISMHLTWIDSSLKYVNNTTTSMRWRHSLFLSYTHFVCFECIRCDTIWEIAETGRLNSGFHPLCIWGMNSKLRTSGNLLSKIAGVMF